MAKEIKPKEKPSFEAQVKKLESLVSKIESGGLGLEDTLKTFEEGMQLSRACQELLNQTELRIQKLVEEQGAIRTEPLVTEGVEEDDTEEQPLTR